MTFWCLYGVSKDVSDEDTQIIYQSSDELISELKTHRIEGNQKKIDTVIFKIQALRQGLDITEQTQLREFLDVSSQNESEKLSQTTLDDFPS